MLPNCFYSYENTFMRHLSNRSYPQAIEADWRGFHFCVFSPSISAYIRVRGVGFVQNQLSGQISGKIQGARSDAYCTVRERQATKKIAWNLSARREAPKWLISALLLLEVYYIIYSYGGAPWNHLIFSLLKLIIVWILSPNTLTFSWQRIIIKILTNFWFLWFPAGVKP